MCTSFRVKPDCFCQPSPKPQNSALSGPALYIFLKFKLAFVHTKLDPKYLQSSSTPHTRPQSEDSFITADATVTYEEKHPTQVTFKVTLDSVSDPQTCATGSIANNDNQTQTAIFNWQTKFETIPPYMPRFGLKKKN